MLYVSGGNTQVSAARRQTRAALLQGVGHCLGRKDWGVVPQEENTLVVLYVSAEQHRQVWGFNLAGDSCQRRHAGIVV